MKKGLRPVLLSFLFLPSRPALRPDEEGIKTAPAMVYHILDKGPALRPDEEGIKTQARISPCRATESGLET